MDQMKETKEGVDEPYKGMNKKNDVPIKGEDDPSKEPAKEWLE